MLVLGLVLGLGPVFKRRNEVLGLGLGLKGHVLGLGLVTLVLLKKLIISQRSKPHAAVSATARVDSYGLRDTDIRRRTLSLFVRLRTEWAK